MLPNISQLNNLVEQYSGIHHDENVDDLKTFLKTCGGDEDLYSRKNFNGHVTTSAVIINSENKLLMVVHAVFDKLLPPGGHVENEDDSLVAASMRESREETGVSSDDLEYVPLDKNTSELPFDINSHPIPMHPEKKEPPHVHHDLRYVFRYHGNGVLTPDKDETKGAQWVPVDDLDKVSDMQPVQRKLLLMHR